MNTTSKTRLAVVIVADVVPAEVNRWPRSAAACWLRPRRLENVLAAPCPVRAVRTMRSGKTHDSRVPASIMAWFMKSSATRRCHRYAANESACFFLARSATPSPLGRIGVVGSACPVAGGPGASEAPSVIIWVLQRSLDVIPQPVRHAGDGRDDPAEPGHRGDGQQDAGDFVLGRARRQRPGGAP